MNKDKEKDPGTAPEAEAADMDWTRRFDEDQPGVSEAMAEAEAAADAKEKRDSAERPPMPKPTFATFVMSLASSALVQLGEVPDPASGQTGEDLVMAKHSIDILAMLQDKIQNGMDKEEEKLLNGLLYELRMMFVMKK